MTNLKRQLSIVEEAESAVEVGLGRAEKLMHIVPIRGGSVAVRV